MSPANVTQRRKVETVGRQEAERDVTEEEGHGDWQVVTVIGKYVICVSAGFMFGFAMEKGRVFEPVLIHKMMLLENFTMLKMFLSAMSAGMFSMSLLAVLPPTHKRFIAVCDDFYDGLSSKSVTSSLLGGLLIGVGMPLAGSCPTSVFTQLGAFVPNAAYTLYGGLAATLMYGLIKPVLDDLTRPSFTESSNPWKNAPYFLMATPLAAMFGGLVWAFEMLIPWTSEIKVSAAPVGLWARAAWPPYVAGLIIGALQLPLILGISQTLGGTSSLITIVSQPFVGPLKKVSPYLAGFRCGFHSWWQVVYVSGVALGAYSSASLSGSLGSASGVAVGHAFTGGFLMMLGARIAGGCTSGHGISGMGFMSILSLITVSAMFGGGILTAFTMRFTNMLSV